MKKGFTLAEVLITLGIIGIVAAMTLPALINKFELIVLKNQFKKQYSIFSQNLLKTSLDYDGNPQCYYSGDDSVEAIFDDCKEFYKKFAKNLKLIKTCEGNALSDGCIPEYAYTASDLCSGFSVDTVNTKSTVYVVADGAIIIPYGNNTGNFQAAQFLLDINGKQGPNKVGKDVFGLSIIKQSSGQLIFDPTSILSCIRPENYNDAFVTLEDIYK